MSEVDPLGGETVFTGYTFDVRVERFRHSDGEIVTREIVRRQDAVAIVAFDEHEVWLVRQPREALGRYSLELPAGRLDVEGETPLHCAQRELAEEIGRAAACWQQIAEFHPSSGYSDERVHVFAATGLTEAHAQSAENERIEIVRAALIELDATIEDCDDAKTLIGLRWLQRQRREPDR